MISYVLYSMLISSFVYPTVAHAVWSSNGVFSISAKEPFRGVGCIDFAGAGVVHVLGGLTALTAAAIMGPRKGRFHDSEGNIRKAPKEMPGQSVSLQPLGTFILWFGWCGFNAGKKIYSSLRNHTTSTAERPPFLTIFSNDLPNRICTFAHQRRKHSQSGCPCCGKYIVECRGRNHEFDAREYVPQQERQRRILLVAGSHHERCTERAGCHHWRVWHCRALGCCPDRSHWRMDLRSWKYSPVTLARGRCGARYSCSFLLRHVEHTCNGIFLQPKRCQRHLAQTSTPGGSTSWDAARSMQLY